jgi:hypothetical protein
MASTISLRVRFCPSGRPRFQDTPALVVAIAFAPPAAISAALPGWHADRPADKLDEAVIPVLSLGATRRFLIKPDRGGRSTVITTHGGDLVVLGGRCQKDYKHSVPKQRVVAGPRLSLNFSASPPRPAVAAKGHR